MERCKKRPRVDLTVAQKQQICRFYQKNPLETIKNLQDHFSEVFNLTIGHSTIGNILKRAEHWNSIEFPDNVRRTPSTKFSNMEKELFDWICNSPEPVSESVIKEKAFELVSDNRIMMKEWTAQRGWITSFKRRFNLIVVPLLSNSEDGMGEPTYRPGKMPVKREPVRRIALPKGRKPSRLALMKPLTAHADTSSIIYDAAIENILQETVNNDPQTGCTLKGYRNDCRTGLSDEPMPNSSTSKITNTTASPLKKIQTAMKDAVLRVNAQNSDRLSKTSPVDTSSITHEVAIENVLELTGETHQHDNSIPTSSADVFPVVLHTDASSVQAPSVTIPNAQMALSTLAKFFQHNCDSPEDLEHVRALDARLKWLSAKEAISNLRTYMSLEPLRNQQDIQYLNSLEERL